MDLDRAERVCTQACQSNYECPQERLRCEAVSADEAYCLFGPRGDAPFGHACDDTGLDCVSGLCLDAEPGHGRPTGLCTEPCQENVDCGAPLPYCQFWFGSGICLPIPPGATGGLCHVNEPRCDVDGDTCQDLAELGPRCTRACDFDVDCDESYLTCRPAVAGGGNLCLPAGVDE